MEKTELALQYAYQQLQANTYPGGLCWINARSQDVGIAILEFACTQLGLPEPPAILETLLEKVQWVCRRWQGEPILVVLDDVTTYEGVKPYLNLLDRRFRVLMTTRLKLFTADQRLDLEVLTEAAALELLRSLVTDGRIDQQLAVAQRVCDWLGYLPLGLELVGRYLAQSPDTSLAKLEQRLQAKRLEANALKEAAPEMTVPRNVVAAFELSWDTLNEAGRELAGLLSLFALAEIPWGLVAHCFPDWDEEDLEGLRNKQLLGGHLLQRTGEGMYQLHQLLREFFAAKRAQMPNVEALQPAFFDVMRLEVQRSIETPTQSQRQETALVIPHLQVAIERVEAAAQWTDVALGLDWLAALYNSQGRYAEAEPLLVRSLQIKEQQLGGEHPDVATSLNNLALLYYS